MTIRDEAMASMNPKVLITEQITNSVFDRVFQSTFDVKFNFNPNMRAFKRARNNLKTEKPLILIYYDPFLMSLSASVFHEVLTQGYEEMFDIYITDD